MCRHIFAAPGANGIGYTKLRSILVVLLPHFNMGSKLNPPKVTLGSSQFHLPRSRIVRLALGSMLILGGLLGFLPLLGFWMIPLGLVILSVDLPSVRRWRRRLTLWWARRKGGKVADNGRPGAKDRNRS